MGVFIIDEFGNPRISIYVDENNQARFKIIDEEGEVVGMISENE